MRNLALLGASAVVLALGVAGASAEPFNPVFGYNGSSDGVAYGYPHSWAPDEGLVVAAERSASSSPILEQFHEGK